MYHPLPLDPRDDRFDFQRYIERHRRLSGAGERGEGYAYAGDLKVLRTMRSIKPVELAVASVVRFWKSMLKPQLLGQAVKVTASQFPKIHELTVLAASRLGVEPPQVYVVPALGALNAATLGTDDDAFIMINSATVDHMTDDELLFIVGHECGHVQNNHVVYTTALYYLTYAASIFLRWIVTPAVIALNSWSRRAELTCDRAGLLSTRSLDAGERALIKLAVGSQKLYEQLDVEEYLKQLEEGDRSIGRVSELLQSHPYLPKRVKALRLFAESDVFRRAMGESGGRPKADVDEEVSKIVSVLFKEGDRARDEGGKDGSDG